MPPRPPPSDGELLARIDERTTAMLDRMDEYVTKAEFAPIKALVFGAVAVILIAVLGALITLATGISG